MKQIEMSDAQLVSLFKKGNEEAFEILVRKYKNRVYSTIYLIVKDSYIAEDLLQEAFIKCIDRIRAEKYNEEGKFLPWILRIAHNLAIDQFRKNKRNPTIVMDDGSLVFNSLNFSEDSYESLQMKNDTINRLREMIHQLPEPQREVLLLRHYADMSFQEIAEATGVSINTSLGRMRYALINLRKLFEKSKIAYDQNYYPK